MWGGKMGDPTAWGVSVAMVVCAMVLAGSVLWGRRVLHGVRDSLPTATDRLAP
jgi:hypothetical protein